MRTHHVYWHSAGEYTFHDTSHLTSVETDFIVVSCCALHYTDTQNSNWTLSEDHWLPLGSVFFYWILIECIRNMFCSFI